MTLYEPACSIIELEALYLDAGTVQPRVEVRKPASLSVDVGFGPSEVSESICRISADWHGI